MTQKVAEVRRAQQNMSPLSVYPVGTNPCVNTKRVFGDDKEVMCVDIGPFETFTRTCL